MWRMWHHNTTHSLAMSAIFGIQDIEDIKYEIWLYCILLWLTYAFLLLTKDEDIQRNPHKTVIRLTTCRNLFLQVIKYANKILSASFHLFTSFRSRKRRKVEALDKVWGCRLGFITVDKEIYIFTSFVGCNVCGRNHNTESCSFLRELKPVSI